MASESDSDSTETTDHDEIRNWAEERGGRPARVEGTGDGGEGVLRIAFPDAPQGDDSRFSKLVSRNR